MAVNTKRVRINYKNANDNLDAFFELNAILLASIAVTSLPNKTAYHSGENIDYTGLVVTANYDNGSSKDVTSLCSIFPQSGKAFDVIYDSQVDIVYREGQDEQSCNFALTEFALQRIYVATAPSKTSYKRGEAINYAGIVVKAVYSDDSEVDVTSLCTYSANAGTAFEPDMDTSIEISYSEGETEVSTSIALTYVSMSLQVTAPIKTAYKAGEAIDYTGLVVKAVYSDGSESVVTDDCVLTPAAGTAYEPGAEVIITYTEFGETQTATVALTEVSLTSVSVSSTPTKTSYKPGETIDYTGLVVTATYSDGSTEDITSSCSITPAAGKTFDPQTDTSVGITYSEYGSQSEVSTSLALTELYMTGISVTATPTKTSYKPGESIDYTGLVVIATYSDGSTEDITSSCSITPAAGKAFDPQTDTGVSISYAESGITETTSISLTAITLTGISVAANPTKTAYNPGETIDYAGLEVIATYSDGSTEDVTSLCSISPAAGTVINADTTVAISYSGQTCTLLLTVAATASLVVDTMPSKISYGPGETADYTGAVIKAVYPDGTEHTVTGYCDFTPASGLAPAQIVTVSCAPPACL